VTSVSDTYTHALSLSHSHSHHHPLHLMSWLHTRFLVLLATASTSDTTGWTERQKKQPPPGPKRMRAPSTALVMVPGQWKASHHGRRRRPPAPRQRGLHSRRGRAMSRTSSELSHRDAPCDKGSRPEDATIAAAAEQPARVGPAPPRCASLGEPHIGSVAESQTTL
jgi:hypothetical protein